MTTSNPMREYTEECVLDAFNHAVTRHPAISYEDFWAGIQDALRQAPEAYENAQPEDYGDYYREQRALRVRHQALS